MKLADKPTFPETWFDASIQGFRTDGGLTIRQYAAIQAMKGMLAYGHDSNDGGCYWPVSEIPNSTVEIADALIAELEKE